MPCLMPNRRESQKVPRKTRRLTRTPLGHLPYTRWGEAGILGLGLGGWLVCAALLLLIVVVVGRWAAHGETWRKVPVVVRLLRELADHAKLASVRLPEHVLVKHAAVHKKAPLIGHDIEHLVSPERGRFGHFVIVPLRDEESVNRHDVVRSIHWSRWQIGDRDAFNLQRDGRQSRDRAAPVLEDMGNEDPHWKIMRNIGLAELLPLPAGSLSDPTIPAQRFKGPGNPIFDVHPGTLDVLENPLRNFRAVTCGLGGGVGLSGAGVESGPIAKNKAHLARAGGTRAAKNAGVAGGPSGSAWAPAVAIHQ